MISLLLGAAQLLPRMREVAGRARDATRAFAEIHPASSDDAGS